MAVIKYKNENGEYVEVPAVVAITGGSSEPVGNEGLIEYIEGSVTHIVIPDGTTAIRPYCFYQYFDLASVEIPATMRTIGGYAFCYGKLTSINLPEGVERVGNYAFANNMFETFKLPSTINHVGQGCFAGCSNLKSIIFQSKVTQIMGATLFKSCDNLTDIYVPWRAGEVENAPWGATNAKIHYNYTGA